MTTSATSCGSRTRRIATKSHSPVTEYASATPVDVGERAAEPLDRGALGLDEDDRVGHLTVCVPPGSSTTTSEKPAFWTSDLKASASVSIGGNVL